MDIKRRGAERNRGNTTIISGLSFKTGSKYRWQDNVSWDSGLKRVIIKAPRVRHTDGNTRHDYSISLTLNDVSSLIDLLGHAGSASDAKLLRDHLNKNVPAIVKLLACATGVVPTPMPDDEDDEDAT